MNMLVSVEVDYSEPVIEEGFHLRNQFVIDFPLKFWISRLHQDRPGRGLFQKAPVLIHEEAEIGGQGFPLGEIHMETKGDVVMGERAKGLKALLGGRAIWKYAHTRYDPRADRVKDPIISCGIRSQVVSVDDDLSHGDRCP